jgi:hypothetical protein
MRGPSSISVVLSSAQRRELERRVREQKTPKRTYLRAKCILLAAEGWSNCAIAAKLDFSRDCVVDWRHRFVAEGLDGLRDRPRSGRPPRFSPRTKASSRGPGLYAAS